MGIQTEKIKSVILCKERGFKNACVGILIDIAFPAEKIWVESAEAAWIKMAGEAQAENLVMNGNDFESDSISSILSEIHKNLLTVRQKKSLKFLVYLSESDGKNIEKLKEDYPYMKFKTGQPTKGDFTETFNPIKIVSAVVGKNNKKPAIASNFIEATKHIKSTLSLINEVAHDKSKISEFTGIGQKFNGFIGTFSFMGGKEGFSQLKNLAIIIDYTCRYYQSDKAPKVITSEHFNLVLESAKTSYLMLKHLRNGERIPKDQMASAEKISLEFKNYPELQRTQFDQNSVDALMESLDKGTG